LKNWSVKQKHRKKYSFLIVFFDFELWLSTVNQKAQVGEGKIKPFDITGKMIT